MRNYFFVKRELDKSYSRESVLVVLGLLVVFGGLLVLEGRPAWCKFGLGFWSAAWTHCTSQHFLDPYSLTHMLHGVIFFWLLRPLAGRVELRWRLIAAVVLEMAWELLENSPWVIERYRQATASLDYTGDSILNSYGDVLASIVGFVLASRVSWKVAVALFVIVEVGLLIFVRDNLTLNIIMLFFPLEALKQWQLRGW